MGRYTTVQAYADNNANMRSISYEQAKGSDEPKQGGGVGVKPEKVVNPYGSTAGAGSGEFHVYRHARGREMARWKQLDEEEKQAQLDEEFQSQVEKYKTQEEQKTAQRRKKRQRQKEAKQRKKNLKLAGVVAVSSSSSQQEEEVADDDGEFTYAPMYTKQSDMDKKEQGEEEENKDSLEALPKTEFANDGSFLQQMKKKLEAESQKEKGTDDAEEPPDKKRAVEK